MHIAARLLLLLFYYYYWGEPHIDLTTHGESDTCAHAHMYLNLNMHTVLACEHDQYTSNKFIDSMYTSDAYCITTTFM